MLEIHQRLCSAKPALAPPRRAKDCQLLRLTFSETRALHAPLRAGARLYYRFRWTNPRENPDSSRLYIVSQCGLIAISGSITQRNLLDFFF